MRDTDGILCHSKIMWRSMVYSGYKSNSCAECSSTRYRQRNTVGVRINIYIQDIVSDKLEMEYTDCASAHYHSILHTDSGIDECVPSYNDDNCANNIYQKVEHHNRCDIPIRNRNYIFDVVLGG